MYIIHRPGTIPNEKEIHQLKNLVQKLKNRSQIDGSGRKPIASNGDYQHPTGEFRLKLLLCNLQQLRPTYYS